ncbi:MAG: hypothetical protein NDF55_00580 [archaeon GB-1867-005]|nr:hypothetical protein [Candidatus Culexmicrobium cathedralense]
MRFLVPLDDDCGLDSPVSDHFGRASFHAIVALTSDGHVTFKIENVMLEHGDRCGVIDLLNELSVDAVIVKGIGVRAASAFQSKGISIYLTNSKTLGEVIDEVKQQKLTPYNPQISSCSGMAYGRGRRRGYPFMPYQLPPPMMPLFPTARTTAQRPRVKSGMLRVAVACIGRGGLDDFVSMQFGRAPAFTIIDLEEGQVKNVAVEPNQYIYQPHGVGIAVSQYLANKGVQVVIAGRFGPNASSVLQSLGIRMVTVPPNIKVKDALRYVS